MKFWKSLFFIFFIFRNFLSKSSRLLSVNTASSSPKRHERSLFLGNLFGSDDRKKRISQLRHLIQNAEIQLEQNAGLIKRRWKDNETFGKSYNGSEHASSKCYRKSELRFGKSRRKVRHGLILKVKKVIFGWKDWKVLNMCL